MTLQEFEEYEKNCKQFAEKIANYLKTHELAGSGEYLNTQEVIQNAGVAILIFDMQMKLFVLGEAKKMDVEFINEGSLCRY